MCVQEEAKQLDAVNISVVVDSKEGPRFPTLRNVSTLGLVEVSDRLKAELGAAPTTPSVAGALRISDFTSLGVSNVAEILETVSTSALSVSAPRKVAQLQADGKVRFSSVATVTLSTDARIIDAETAERLLTTVQKLLASPSTLL